MRFQVWESFINAKGCQVFVHHPVPKLTPCRENPSLFLYCHFKRGITHLYSIFLLLLLLTIMLYPINNFFLISRFIVIYCCYRY